MINISFIYIDFINIHKYNKKGEKKMKNKKSIRGLYLSVETEINDDLVLINSYKEIVNHRNEKEEFLENQLTETNFKLFQEYVDIESEMQGLEMEETFIRGCSIAYQLFVDSLQ